MIKNINISAKVTIIILIISFVAVGAISFFTYDYNKRAQQEKFTFTLNGLADSRAEYFNSYFQNVAAGIKVIQHADVITEAKSETLAAGFDMGSGFDTPAATEAEPDSVASEEVEKVVEKPAADPVLEFIKEQKEAFGFDEVSITSITGDISTTTDTLKNFVNIDGAMFSYGQKEIYFGPVLKHGNDYINYVTAPLETPTGKKLLIVKLNLNEKFKILKKYGGLGETGEIILARQDPISNKIFYISPLRENPNAPITVMEGDEQEVVVNTLENGSLSTESEDYRNNNTMQVTRKIETGNWVVIAKVDVAEANGDSGQLIKAFIYASLCILALTVLLSMIISRSITQPLYAMRNKLGMVAQGILPEKDESHSNDEFGQMGSKVDDLVQTLRENADFAKRIGEGKYDTEFKAASDNDVLGMSLLNMRKNLIENERRDKERNWIVRGVAEISEILRLHDSLDSLGDDVIKFILDKIGAIQGAFYVVNDENENMRMIEMRASDAYGRKKYLQTRFKFAEGMVGQAVAEQDTVLRTEIPDSFVTITSGILGDQRPTCILIVPLITNEEVYGVLEFAGFKKFDSSQVKFVQELSLILARTIFNIRVNERTRKLLEESQAMSNELSEKQEVLRQNAEEMQATQEELQRTNQQLEEQIEEVNRTQKRMQLLLENASEVITICEEDKTIRYISPSVETILGYAQKEIIGNSDEDNVHPDHKEVFRSLFAKLEENPDEKVTVQYEYKTKDGLYIWIESTGTNMMTNPAIHGFILNSRDITEKRRAEQEQRMRSKMQALSENSPDLITRLEAESISYINPIIEAYAGKGTSAFLNKKVKDVELDPSVLNKWLEIVEEVNSTNDKVATEMDFPSEMGTRVMQVNAIPEYDDLNMLESVLVVSHDITDRKVIELEIQNKNKKITESINYAKRIQNAILPNDRVINRALPDSFTLYKPRDVVSGDFPWYVQIKDEIFIAAVDCTGHGVPGALLSLIGYFLLNDIVRSRKITEPGKVLDLLDEGVTTTLRQDEDSTTKDGMDIAFCKINLSEKEVEFAGAHRPLYIMKDGVMEEIKGNKFPIGGGIFKNQTNFTNHKVKLKKGDSIYFSSDGFPDQFGGPESRKFGPKRVREIIGAVHQKSMTEAMHVFDTEWENWRGDTKQTDDVLLIGIKF